MKTGPVRESTGQPNSNSTPGNEPASKRALARCPWGLLRLPLFTLRHLVRFRSSEASDQTVIYPELR